MTEQEQRIAIAEFCGWHDVASDNRGGTLHGTWPLTGVVSNLPDYFHDLNAIHEAWQRLDRKQRVAFSRCLRIKVVSDGGHKASFDEDIVACCENATAAQRAEALLKAIGKWKD